MREISKLIGTGITPSRGDERFWKNGTIPWLKTEQLGEHKIYDTTEKITQIAVDETFIKVFPANTIAIAMYGEGRTRGNVSILKKAMTTNQACCNIVLDDKKADVEYVYYFLKTQYQNLRKLSSGIRKNLNANDIKDFEIRLPPKIETQRQIAAVLSALDAKIELNRRINAELEALAKTLYDYWFVQFDFPFDFAQGRPDAEGKPYKTSGGKMVWREELRREVPEGWEVEELRKFLTSNRGVSYAGTDISDDGVPMINLNSFNTNASYKQEGIKMFSGAYNKSKVLKPFDLVMCNTQQTALDPQKDIIGKSLLIPDIFETDVVSSHHVTTITVSKDALKYYLNSLFNTEYFHRYISGYATGTNILGLNFEGVLSYRTAIPHDDLLSKYKSIVLTFEQQKSRIIKETRHLTALRDWLLPLLMNGQVRVG